MHFIVFQPCTLLITTKNAVLTGMKMNFPMLYLKLHAKIISMALSARNTLLILIRRTHVRKTKEGEQWLQNLLPLSDSLDYRLELNLRIARYCVVM